MSEPDSISATTPEQQKQAGTLGEVPAQRETDALEPPQTDNETGGETLERGQMDLIGHLTELRRRLAYSLVAIALTTIVGWLYSGTVFELLSAPYYSTFPKSSLIGTGPAEAFTIRLKVALLSGVTIAMPFLLWQLWLFIEPALYRKEKNYALPFVLLSCLLFITGVWFCYSWVLPVAYNFFHEQYIAIGLSPVIRLSEQLSTAAFCLLGFGIVFELPIIAFFLARMGIVNHKFLIAKARHATVLIFVIAAILTPPDVFSQFLMAIPLLLLYGISIIVVRFAE